MRLHKARCSGIGDTDIKMDSKRRDAKNRAVNVDQTVRQAPLLVAVHDAARDSQISIKPEI